MCDVKKLVAILIDWYSLFAFKDLMQTAGVVFSNMGSNNIFNVNRNRLGVGSGNCKKGQFKHGLPIAHMVKFGAFSPLHV